MADATSTTADAVFRIFIEADIQRVWAELTKTDAPQAAFFDALLHTRGLQPGAAIQMRTASGEHVLVVGKVIAFEPPRLYAHTHRFTQHDDPVCQVIYELKPVGRGVEVTLRVTGLTGDTPTAKSMNRGGTSILGNLKAIAETGRARPGSRALNWLLGRLEFMLPARTEVARWPLDEDR